MSTQTVITLRQLCGCFSIDIGIVREFADFGLYPVVTIEGETGIEARYLDRLERIISLYQTLGINKEGIEIILDLRGKISDLQDHVDELRNEVQKLKHYFGTDDPELLKRLGLLIEIDD